MDLRGFAPSTQKLYLMHLQHFFKHFNTSFEERNYDHVREYLLNAIKVRKLSSEYINASYSAIRFLYESVFERDWNMKHVPRLKKSRKLPKVLSMDEVKLIFNSTQNLKHKAIFVTTYSAGLRVSEVANLRVSDINSKNMQIFIRQGKGNKDRYAILSHTALNILREYYKVYKPIDWLFPGQYPSKPIHTRTIQNVFKESLIKSGIKKDATPHTLRHSFATHLIENDTNILKVKELLGHDNINTTIQYIHLAKNDVFSIVSPIDLIGGICND